MVQVTHHDNVVRRDGIFCNEDISTVCLREVGNNMVTDAEALVLNVLDQWRKQDVTMVILLNLLLLEDRLLILVLKFNRNIDSVDSSGLWLRNNILEGCLLLAG